MYDFTMQNLTSEVQVKKNIFFNSKFVHLDQRWAKCGPRPSCGPRDHFMRPAGSYRNIYSCRESSQRSFFLLFSSALNVSEKKAHLRPCRPFCFVFCSSLIFGINLGHLRTCTWTFFVVCSWPIFSGKNRIPANVRPFYGNSITLT